MQVQLDSKMMFNLTNLFITSIIWIFTPKSHPIAEERVGIAAWEPICYVFHCFLACCLVGNPVIPCLILFASQNHSKFYWINTGFHGMLVNFRILFESFWLSQTTSSFDYKDFLFSPVFWVRELLKANCYDKWNYINGKTYWVFNKLGASIKQWC